MIQTRRNHPIVKFAYMFNGFEPPQYGLDLKPYKTSLCPMFWRCVMNLVALLAASALVLAGIFFGGRGLIRHWRHVLIAAGMFLGSMAFVAGFVFVMDKKGLGVGSKVGATLRQCFDATTESISNSLAWQMFKSVKSKICPIVTFTAQK